MCFGAGGIFIKEVTLFRLPMALPQSFNPSSSALPVASTVSVPGCLGMVSPSIPCSSSLCCKWLPGRIKQFAGSSCVAAVTPQQRGEPGDVRGSLAFLQVALVTPSEGVAKVAAQLVVF